MERVELTQDEFLRIITRAQNGDSEAENFLVENNIGLVRSVVRRFLNRGCEYDDLIQIGSIGLLKAIKKFDIAFNVRFSTYAIPMIIGEIKRFLRDDGKIKVSRSLKEIAYKAHTTKETLEKDYGREPTISEIASVLEISKEDLVIALESVQSTEYLYETIHQDDGSPILLIDRISCNEGEDSDIVDRLALKEMLSALEPKERQIIMLRYFRDMTQCQVAEILGISQVQVSRIEKKIINKLRQSI
ncbi:MAG TPA: RNA polymerase sporulation sigma factor SigF [Bacillota bacterium]|nr:RNA polymerase sporulation sigma factor SigF [Bacillota bacterium]HOR85748.1 RNA polymerase sporulation sigma factor SigF [Bacillota bacterium]HPL53314.1 RNA polymerase sporulation sigma factor SigF [Bacillota bacterium]